MVSQVVHLVPSSVSRPLWPAILCALSVFHASALDPSKSTSQYAHTIWKQSLLRHSVFAVEQDKAGYLWLGTEGAGPLRFDGEHFIQPEPILSGSTIYSLRQAKDGGMWIGMVDGLGHWKDGRLTKYTKHDGLDGGGVTSIYEADDGVVWIGTYGYQSGGLARLEHGRIQTFESLQGIYAVFGDHAGRLWIGGRSGLTLWDERSPLIVPRRDVGEVWSIGENAEHRLWLATDVGVRSYFHQRITQYPLPPGKGDVQPRRVLVDRDGGLWIGTRGQGLFHLHGGKWDHMTHADGLSSDVIWALFEDREGTIWVGTASGLDQFREFAVTTISTRDGLPGDAVVSLIVDQERQVCAGIQGVGIHCLPSGDKERLPFRNASILSMCAIQGDGIVVATDHGVYDARAAERPISTTLNAVYAMAEDDGHNLWLGDARQGLFRWTRDGKLSRVPDQPFKGTIMALLVDHAGRLWIADNQGGVTLHQNGTFRPFVLTKGLRSGYVPSLLEDHTGAIWAATEAGLSFYQGGSFSTLSTRNGIPCDNIHAILEDDSHNFWLATSCGLLRTRLDELQRAVQSPAASIHYELFGASDGFRATVLHATNPRVAKTPDGRLWFASDDGIAYIDPQHIARNTVPPPVHIEQMLVDGKINPKRGVRLPPTASRLQFDYTGLSFADPERVMFRYQLEGFDATWIDAGTRRQAFYTNLRPGSYRFHVIACNNHQVWNEQGDSLDFEIESAFLQTRLFGWLCAAAAMLFLRFVYYVNGHHTPGALLHRWFRAYPIGFPGAGLLLLRLAVGMDLLTHVIFFSPFTMNPGSVAPQIARVLEACAGLTLIAGLTTPIVGGLLIWVLLVEMVQRGATDAAYASRGGAWEYGILYLVVLGSLTLLGPGAYSIDARLFGTRTVRVPHYTNKTKSSR